MSYGRLSTLIAAHLRSATTLRVYALRTGSYRPTYQRPTRW